MTKQVRKLTAQQQKSIRLFLSSCNDTEVAEELGVARQTVNIQKENNLLYSGQHEFIVGQPDHPLVEWLRIYTKRELL